MFGLGNSNSDQQALQNAAKLTRARGLRARARSEHDPMKRIRLNSRAADLERQADDS